ncbi:MAG TPA: hypothetical protein PK048_02340 [Candidatus Absconditabacterales bacterium]|nr:hypothetical protein [Candidatus Absconditabacterales bacterium]
MRLLYRLLLFILYSSGVILIYYLRTYPNIFQLDMGGQIASTHFFGELGLHGYNPYRFGGFINNLFYPPLQDIIVSSIKRLCGSHDLITFQIYLTILVCTYLTTFVLIGSRFKTRSAKVLFMVLIIGYLHLEKTNLTFFQGLGYIDIAFTGLISEILGGVFLNLLLFELTGKRRYYMMLLYTIGTFLSHLVVGPVAFVVMGLGRLIYKDKHLLRNCIAGAALTSFFWVPFVTYKSYMTSDSIVLGYPFIITFGLLFLTWYFFQETKKIQDKPEQYITNNAKAWLIILITGLICILPSEIFFGFGFDIPHFHNFFPKFHYSRLVTISLMFLLIGTSARFDIFVINHESGVTQNDNQKKKQSPIMLGVVGVAFLSILYIYAKSFGSIFIPQIFEQMVGFTDRKGFNIDIMKTIQDDKRILVIDARRSVDFNLDSYFQYQGYTGLYFVKGLFRESNRANNVLTSYLATTLTNSDLVVGYNYFYNLSCSDYQGFIDHFTDDYGIGWIVVADLFGANSYLSDDKKKCYDGMFRSSSTNNNYHFVGDFGINNITYHLFKIESKYTGWTENELVSPIEKAHITILDQKTSDFYYDKILFSKKKLIEQQMITGTQKPIHEELFVVKQDYQEKPIPTLENIQPGVVRSRSISDTQKTPGIVLSMNISGNNNTFTRVKLTYYEGISAYDKQGNKLKVYPLYHGFLVQGSGEIIITYHKPNIMVYSYRFSIISLAVRGGLFWYTHKGTSYKHKKNKSCIVKTN